MLDLQNLPSAQRIQSNTVSNFDLLGLSGPAMELRKFIHSFHVQARMRESFI